MKQPPLVPGPTPQSLWDVDRRGSAAATREQRGTRALSSSRKVGEHAPSACSKTSRAAEHDTGAGAGLADLVTRQRGHDSRIEAAAGGPLPRCLDLSSGKHKVTVALIRALIVHLSATACSSRPYLAIRTRGDRLGT